MLRYLGILLSLVVSVYAQTSNKIDYLRQIKNNPTIVWAPSFAFSQSPGGVITAGVSNVVTLTPVPPGVNGTDTSHSLWISGCSGGNQAVTITGGTAVSEAASGTIIFTPTNSCNAGWSISDLGGGIQNAICSLGSAGGGVTVGTGTVALNAPLTWCGKTSAAIYMQTGVTFTGSGSLPTPTNTNRVWFPGVNSSGRGGVVVVYPPSTYATNAPGIAVAPDGHLISCAGTTTACLQEAEDYAWNNGQNLYVVGGAEPGTQVCAGCSGPNGAAIGYFFATGARLEIRPQQGGWRQFGSVTISCNNSTYCIALDSQVMSDIYAFGAQVGNGGTGGCFLFDSRNPITDASPGTGGGFVVSNFFMPTCVASNPNAVLTEFNMDHCTTCGGAGIGTNQFYFREQNGGAVSLKIDDSPGNGVSFQGNKIVSLSNHGQTGTQPIIQIGTSSTNAGLINSNTFDLLIGSSSTGHGVDNWGNFNYIEIVCGSGTQDYCVYNQATAEQTTVLAHQLAGVNRIDNGYSIGGPGMVSTQILGIRPPTAVPMTTLTSGVMYTNLDGIPETIMISGGTVSAVSLCSAAGSCYNTSRTAGDFNLKPGQGLLVVYSVAPTVVKII